MSDTKSEKTHRRKLVLVPCVAALVLVPWTLQSQHRQSEQHERFYNAGKTINGFLKDYCNGLEQAVLDGSVDGAPQDARPVADLVSERFRSPERGSWQFTDPQLSAVNIRRVQAVQPREFNRDDMLADLDSYLGQVASLKKTICKIDLVETMDPPHSARLTVKIILDGKDPQGEAFQDRMFYRWHLANEAQDGSYLWRIRRDELVEGIRVSGDRGALVPEEDPGRLGIDFAHRRDPNLDIKKYRDELKFGVIQHASGGISAADFNHDGRPDLLFMDGVESRLYRNDGPSDDGSEASFTDVTQDVGLDGLDRAHVGLFADFDNDGDRDLFVGRYLAGNRYYENVGGNQSPRFEEKSAAMGLDAEVPSTSATLLDFDRDGYLDIYLGLNGNAFEALPRLPFYARNGKPNRLLRNQEGKGFVDVTESSGTGDTGWTLAVATGDVNGDGYPDLGVANDFGRKRLYVNQGDGTFEDLAKTAGVLDFSGGMGLVFGDFDDDGDADLYTSNINSNQRWFGEDMTVRQYIQNVSRTKWAVLDAMEYVDLYRLVGEKWTELGQQIGEGNSLFRNVTADDGSVSFEEIKDSHASRAGWGWSVAFFDLDNDTDLDIYAANGWISNQPGTDL